MRIAGFRLQRLLAIVALLASASLLSSCELFSSEQNTLNPEGEVAELQADLLWLVIWIALAVLIVVMAVLLYSLVRFRRKSDDDPLPKQVHGNTRLEVGWTIVPTVILLALAVPITAGIIDLANTPGDDALHIKVIATQWQWRFEYLDEEFQTPDGDPLSVERELHIPVDRDVDVEVTAGINDVIHSFWMPRLAGKTDAIPGRTNHMWFNATEPGTYHGQCAEFCGAPPGGGGHSGMKFEVVAESEAEFNAWAQEQLAGAQASSAGLTQEQRAVYGRFRRAAPTVDEATASNVARNPGGATTYMLAASLPAALTRAE